MGADDLDLDVLGVATLANEPVRHKGFLGSSKTFAFGTRYATAADAWSERVLDGDPSLAPAWAAAARELEAAGAAAITTNCGFAIAYQDAMTAAVRRPVASSALLLAPFILRLIGPARTLGILTADSRRLTTAHLLAAGVAEADLRRIVVVGNEEAASAKEMMTDRPDVDLEQLRADVLGAVDRLMATAGDVGALLFECTGFGPVSGIVRAKTGLPVFDVLVLSRLMIDATSTDAISQEGSR